MEAYQAASRLSSWAAVVSRARRCPPQVRRAAITRGTTYVARWLPLRASSRTSRSRPNRSTWLLNQFEALEEHSGEDGWTIEIGAGVTDVVSVADGHRRPGLRCLAQILGLSHSDSEGRPVFRLALQIGPGRQCQQVADRGHPGWRPAATPGPRCRGAAKASGQPARARLRLVELGIRPRRDVTPIQTVRNLGPATARLAGVAPFTGQDQKKATPVSTPPMKKTNRSCRSSGDGAPGSSH